VLTLGANLMIALRIDDIGASTKRYEVYSEHVWNIAGLKIYGNWLFLKYLPPFRKWGPYREMLPGEWYSIFDLLEMYNAKLTVAVTATWAKSEKNLIPFPQRFPGEAEVLREGLEQGLIEIANHGLTHCVVEGNVFKPRWFSSNRRYHREFWDWVPVEVHEEHIRRSQGILQDYFRAEIVTFVPPGNVFTNDTLEIAERYGLRYVSCQTEPRRYGKINVIGDKNVIPFHDREMVLEGIEWFERLLSEHSDEEHCFVRELGERFAVDLSQV
jgi:hypothetical protein